MSSLTVSGGRGLGARGRSARKRSAIPEQRSLAQELELSAAELARLRGMFADELARGWIPSEHDLRDAVGALRSAGARG